jgi:hypothetical protein
MLRAILNPRSGERSHPAEDVTMALIGPSHERDWLQNASNKNG